MHRHITAARAPRAVVAHSVCLAGLVSAVFLSAPAAGHAQDCGGAERWAERCGSGDVTLSVERCLPGGVIVEARAGSETLSVEIARERPGAFRQVANLGLSPIAEYADWNDAPVDVRRAFDAVVACVEADPSLDVPEGRLATGGGRHVVLPPAPTPWLLGGAFAAIALALFLSVYRRRPSRRFVGRSAITLLVITASGAAARMLFADPNFVHQNGQGPFFVSHALCVTSSYGPGFAEVFGLFFQLHGGEASSAIFTAQALLGALGPPAAFVLCRAVGARPALAAAASLLVALEPAFARIVQSESYYGAISSLLLLAGAVVAVGAYRHRPRQLPFLLSVLAAGLLVAQAARIHPLGWLPAALLPLIVLVSKGRLRTRLALAAVATAGIGLCGTALAGEVIFGVSAGGVGDQWLGDVLGMVPERRIHLGLGLGTGLGVLAVVLARRRRRGVVRGVACFLAAAVPFCSHIVGAGGPVIMSAYVLLFTAPLLAAVVGAAEGAIRTRRQGLATAALVLAAGLAVIVPRAEGVLALPTDVLEQRWLLHHGAGVPPEASLAFVGAAGSRRTLHIPFYGECGLPEPAAFAFGTDRARGDLDALAGPVYWYRSSLCSTDDGRAICDALEAGRTLVPVAETELPAVPSMQGLDYDREDVAIGLYRVER